MGIYRLKYNAHHDFRCLQMHSILSPAHYILLIEKIQPKANPKLP